MAEPAEIDTVEVLKAHREWVHPDEGVSYCYECEEVWPCITSQLATALDRLRADYAATVAERDAAFADREALHEQVQYLCGAAEAKLAAVEALCEDAGAFDTRRDFAKEVRAAATQPAAEPTAEACDEFGRQVGPVSKEWPFEIPDPAPHSFRGREGLIGSSCLTCGGLSSAPWHAAEPTAEVTATLCGHTVPDDEYLAHVGESGTLCVSCWDARLAAGEKGSATEGGDERRD